MIQRKAVDPRQHEYIVGQDPQQNNSLHSSFDTQYKYLKQNNINLDSNKGRKPTRGSHSVSNNRSHIISRFRNDRTQAVQSVLGTQNLNSRPQEEGVDRRAQAIIPYLGLQSPVNSNELGRTVTSSFRTPNTEQPNSRLMSPHSYLERPVTDLLSREDAATRESLQRKDIHSQLGVRASSSQHYRRQSKMNGYDPKAQMIVQYKKDAKNISEILQYKDYVMDPEKESLKSNQTLRVKGGLPVQQQQEVPREIFSAQGRRSSINSSHENSRASFIMKNTFNPSSILQHQQIRRELGALTSVKIPDSLKEAMKKRGDLQGFMKSIKNTGSRSPIRRQSTVTAEDIIEAHQRRKKSAFKTTLETIEDNEYMIKNYRVIQQKKHDFFLPTSPPSRQSTLTPNQIEGMLSPTSNQIRVSNSILSPNTFHFSTRVTTGRRLDPRNQRQDVDLIQNSVITAELTSSTGGEFMNPFKFVKPLKNNSNQSSPDKPAQIIDESDSLSNSEQKQTNFTQYLKILNTDQDLAGRPFEGGQTARDDLIEENFKDVVASWVDDPFIIDRLVQNQDEDDDQDLKNMRSIKDFSAVTVYDLDNSFDSVEVENKMILNMKTQVQIIDERSKTPRQGEGETEAYAHLKARNVFGKKSDDFKRQIELTMQNPDKRTKATVLIELSKDFLTHLDHSQFTIDRLPLEIFDDFLLEADSIKQRIQTRKDEDPPLGPMYAATQYYRVNGESEEVRAEVVDFDEFRKKYIIEFKLPDGRLIRKFQGRLNLVFEDFDSKQSIIERRNLAVKLRRNALFKLNAERLFVHELARKYDYIKMPLEIKNNIKRKIVVDMSKFDPHKVQVLALQVEALFVFSILKSIIYSQIGDPFISRIVAQYKIKEMTVTRKDVTDEITDVISPVPYYALKSYEECGGKLQKMLNKDEARKILQNYACLGKKSFISAIHFIFEQNEVLVQKTPLFIYPITEKKLLIYLHSQDEFRDKSLDQLQQELKTAPVKMHHFIQSSRIISRRFKDTLEYRWTENIAQKVEKLIEKDYKINGPMRDILKTDLNPYLVKLLELIRLHQEKNLYDKLMATVEEYLRFLLQFAIRDEQFRKSKSFEDNEYESLQVRMSPKALIVVEVGVKKTKKVDPLQIDDQPIKGENASIAIAKMFNYDIQTAPSLEDVWVDLINMIDLFIASVSRIKRIDEMVIPQLKLKRNILMPPDKIKSEKLRHLCKLIQIVIDSMRSQPDERVESLKRYTQFLEMTFDSLILDLKIKTYDEQNKNVDSDEDEDGEQVKKEPEKIDIEVYNNMEITEPIFIQCFETLRQAYWDILLTVDSTYDYGMIILDCTAFKNIVSTHIEKLLKRLQDHIVSEFLVKMYVLYNQYKLVQKKATDTVKTIDEVIVLIEFIAQIQKPNELLEELEQMMEEVKHRKNFIDDLYLKLENPDFEKYLELFSFPSRLRMLLIKRKYSLENEREILSGQMKDEKDKVLNAIIGYRENFEFFKNVGLYKHTDTLIYGVPDSAGQSVVRHIAVKGNMRKKSANMGGMDQAKRAQIMSFTDAFGNVFVPQYILEHSDRMEKLKQDIESSELECEIINRREKLLNFRVTKFTAVTNLKGDMQPFITLWGIAQSFTNVYENWLFGSFQDLDSDSMDEMLQDWIKQLMKITKTTISNYIEPMYLVNYLIKELERFREYMPMIAAMRAKGLEKRHWAIVSKNFGMEIVIEPGHLTLAYCIEQKFYEGSKLDMLKQVCEIAMKEYAIKSTLDVLDLDLKNFEFKYAKYKDGKDTYFLKTLDEMLVIFEEFEMKVSSLKTNPFSKPFVDRIFKLEKEFSAAVGILEQWIQTQKCWIYLEPIFSQEEFAVQMVNESQRFNHLDSFYRKELNLIRNDPSVNKYCRRDYILGQLQWTNKEFESISKGLAVYLEAKRETFARFFFLSNEEIIEILGQMRDPKNVQKFLNKIFEGIDALQFTQKGLITGIKSKEGELLPLINSIDPTATAESWLREMESEMKLAVKTAIHNSIYDFRMKDFESWVKAWQGQVVLVDLNIILTENLTEIFTLGQTKRLRDVLNQIVFEIETLTKMIRSKIDFNTRTSICCLLTNRVHARDTIKGMIESDARYACDFSWKLFMKYEYLITSKRSLQEEINDAPPITEEEKQSQKQLHKEDSKYSALDQFGIASRPGTGSEASRFGASAIRSRGVSYNQGSMSTISKEEEHKESKVVLLTDNRNNEIDLCVTMIDARKPYGYEYLGNKPRIVITPLTDRCFRALFMAIHFNYGGAPEGPVGTGKTETTKDLSKCLGKQCFVFNCSSSLDYEAMSKFFKGLATCGAWACFDEFNRIELSVLSVISQIMITMQGAIRENKRELVFEDTCIKFNRECAIFITMNPQFLGRNDLPDNLKSLFRPVSMIVADSTIISEIYLYSYGFMQAKSLSRKLVRAFKLAKQQLSHQLHYEFGLRTIKIVLQIAGLMKLKAAGVIEPDFKIKEGKKDSHPLDSQRTPHNTARTGQGSSRLTTQKKAIDVQPFLNFMEKEESGLDSDDAVKRKRGNSIDSDDFDLNQTALFEQQKVHPIYKKLEEFQIEEKKQSALINKNPQVQFQRFQIENHKATKNGLEKFSTKRKRLAKGNFEKTLDQRMDAYDLYQEGLKRTKKLMKVLGIDDESLIKDEDKIEEFIVLRSINDINVPRLHQNDIAIFKGIIDDIFPNPITQSIKKNSLKSLLEDVIANKAMQITGEITDRIMHLYETVMIRHGVMVVGSTMTGKTTAIQLLQECLNKSRENELEERVQEFKIKKAKKIALQNMNRKGFVDDEQDQEEIKALKNDLQIDELKQVRAQCRNKGVATFTINPKSLTIGQLMGSFDEQSNDWNDGIMANAMRVCSKDTSERRNWIIFDGPIDTDWVENLNSVLDDNKKLTLDTGESIKLSNTMTIILEAEDLAQCTPATISRCGMIYMKEDIVPLKGILNQWIKKLPQFLEDIFQELDQLFNYFIPEILSKFMLQSNLIYPVTHKWAMKNFCRMMDAMLNDYRSDKFAQINDVASTALATFTSPEPSRQYASDTKPNPSGKRPYYLQFADIESRYLNAIKNKSMWIHNFFLFSLIWAFGSILTPNVRSKFEQHIRSKLVCTSEDLATLAANKTKQLSMKKQPTGPPLKVGKKQIIEEVKPVYQPTLGFVEPEKAPFFICVLPAEFNLYDIYFDLETNAWYQWETLMVNKVSDESTPSATKDQTAFKRSGSIFNKFIPTVETIRFGYIVEANLICKNNLLLIGSTGSGKSWLSRETLFKQLPIISTRYKSFSMVYSSGSNSEKSQFFIDSRLEKRRKGVFGPPFSQKFIFFIDDLMMPYKDQFGSQSANELLRQWFDFQGWFDHKSKEFKKIEDIQFLSCVTIYDAHKAVISTRNEWHWTYLGVVNMDERHYQSMFQQIIDNFSGSWPSTVQGGAIKALIKATLDLYAYFEKSIKPTPNKYLYHFNIRHMFKIIFGITDIEPSFLRSEFNLAKLWMHESWRTLCDRIFDETDKKLLSKKMREIAKKYFKIGKDRFSKQVGYPIYSPYNKGSEGLYTESQGLAETTTYLKKFLMEYNEVNKKQRINVVMFDFLVEFLLKVLRIIKQPFSHGIMIGIEGSGKEAICRLSTVLAGYQFFVIKFDAHYSQENWQQDIKQLLMVSGVDMKEVVFHLKHNQIIKESFLDDLNTLVNNGEIQNLFSKDEYEDIVQQVSIRLSGNSDRGAPINPQIALGDFSQRCRENLKVILNFTPTGANLRQRVRDYKQIINCSTVVWMESWPNEGYHEIAELLLPAEDPLSLKIESLCSLHRDSVIRIALEIHQASNLLSQDYFFETQHYLHITPHLFTGLLQTYKSLYNDKRSQLNEMQTRYEQGLERLKYTQDQVEKFQSELGNVSPLLNEKKIEIQKVLDQLRENHEHVGRIKDMLTQEEQELVIWREQAASIKNECEQNLEGATPELNAAISFMQTLSKIDINNLQSLKTPPEALKLLMQGVCMVMGVKPDKVRDKDGINFNIDYWSPAIGNKVLGNPKFIEKLSAFDCATVTTKTMVSLEELTTNPDYVFDNIVRASKTGKGLYLWLQAIKNYCTVYQETIPKRDELLNAEKQMQDKQNEIRSMHFQLLDLQKNLEHLMIVHSNLESDIQKLQAQIDECTIRKDRAAKLLNGLGGEKQKWLVCNRMIDKKFLTIQGDVLLGAAFIVYLSAFTQKFRERSVENWSNIIRKYSINISDDFSFNRTFGDQIQITEWNFNGLPGDPFSIQNAVILQKSLKQSICIDPQFQANKWIKMQDACDLKILNSTDTNFIQQIEFAIKFGKRVLIENVGSKIDLLLYPLINKEQQTEGSTTTVNIFGRVVEIDPNFKLFILSELKNPRFGPDISVMTTQVNFHVTIEGLEEQMLSILISSQKREMEEECIRMRKLAIADIKILRTLEDSILQSLNQQIDQILSDEGLIQTLQTSKKTSKNIGNNLQRVNKATSIMLKSRGIYTPAAYRAALLYFLVSDISKIEYMYQFSLKWYIDIFTDVVMNNKCQTDQDPLLDIIRNFTFTFYRKVCQSIFEKDKLLFTFLLAFRILEGEKCLNDKLFDFFLKGFQVQPEQQPEQQISEARTVSELTLQIGGSLATAVKGRKRELEREELKKKMKAIPWISELQWQTLKRMSLIPPFNKPNIVKHIAENPEQWLTYINSNEMGTMPASYLDYDQVKEDKIMKKLKKQAELSGKVVIEEEEDDSEQEQVKTKRVLSDDEIWDLDDSEEETNVPDTDPDEKLLDDKEPPLKSEEEDQAEANEEIAYSIVYGVADYQEVRYGSVRFEKELLTRKQAVLKDLIKFCVMRVFAPERIVKQIQTFLGSVLDPRFLEPPVFNLPDFYIQTNCFSPILFIQSQNTNVLNELNILKHQVEDASRLQIEYLPLGGNVNEKVQELIVKCATSGQWLLLENLHLVTGWLPVLVQFLQELYRENAKEQQRALERAPSIPARKAAKGQPVVVAPVVQVSQQPTIFPELSGIKIRPKFRIWLSSMPVDYFPISFLQECTKLTLQPAMGVRQNSLKLLNSVDKDFLLKCPEKQQEFRKLFYAMTIFHSVVVERQRFGPLGFSGHAYKFSENDFTISSLQLQYLMQSVSQDDETLPLDLACYLIGTLNYGGRIVKNQDVITLNAILETFLNEKTCYEDNYKLTGADSAGQGFYFVPPEGDINLYKTIISKFPVQDRPEIFGFHKNANIQRMTNEGKDLLERVFEFEFASKDIVKATTILESNDAGISSGAAAGEDSSEDKAASFKKRIITLIQELPPLLDDQLCRQRYPISYAHSFNTLIQKDVQRYNILMQVIYVSLKNALRALEGSIHVNSQIEEVQRSLTYEHVPITWYEYSYPTYKSLSLYMSNLQDRVAFIRSFLVSEEPLSSYRKSIIQDVPVQDYWVSGFFDQQSFFTMLLQQKARDDQVSIENLAIEFRVIKDSQIQLIAANDGCLVHGLQLEAARWQDIEEYQGETITLQDATDGYGVSAYQEMPHIHLRIITQLAFDAKYINERYYHCPLYNIGLRERLQSTYGGGAAAFTDSLIIKVPLYIGQSGALGAKNNYMRQPAFWIKRGSALLCHKDE